MATCTPVSKKYLRYGTVRRTTNTAPYPNTAKVGTPLDNPAFSSLPQIPPVPQIPHQTRLQSDNAGSNLSDLVRVLERGTTDHIQSPQISDIRTLPARGTQAQRVQRKGKETQIQQEENRVATKHQRASNTQMISRKEGEASSILAKQKKKENDMLEAEIGAGGSLQPITSPNKKFTLFSRKKTITKGTPKSPVVELKTPRAAILRKITKRLTHAKVEEPQQLLASYPFVQAPLQSRSDQPLRVELSPMQAPNTISQGEGEFSQPESSTTISDAKERIVLIRYKKSAIKLLTTPDTTCSDLIQNVTKLMAQDISLSHSILLESCIRLELERQLRSYEYVQDIMNSWDYDMQNVLLIQNSNSAHCDRDLDVSQVPKDAPEDLTVHMYHSQIPGKWSKQYITLTSMGQIFISKSPDSKGSNKNVVNICHMSNFDIYTPTPRQLRNVSKPPEKHCHAIKCQQETNRFRDAPHFIHFFCTDDEMVAQKWYTSVQQWRSWYMVYRMGEEKVVSAQTQKSILSDEECSESYIVEVSMDDKPHTTSFSQPFIDNIDRFGSPAKQPSYPQPHLNYEDHYGYGEEIHPRQIPFQLRYSAALPASEHHSHQRTINYQASAIQIQPRYSEEEVLAESRLLGRQYRLQQRQAQKTDMGFNTSPLISADGLLLESMHRSSGKSLSTLDNSRFTSMNSRKERRSKTSGNGIHRSTTHKERSKPLLEFSPTFKEPPQWDKSRKGRGVKGVEGMPLIELATTPVRVDGGRSGMNMTLFRRD